MQMFCVYWVVIFIGFVLSFLLGIVSGRPDLINQYRTTGLSWWLRLERQRLSVLLRTEGNGALAG